MEVNAPLTEEPRPEEGRGVARLDPLPHPLGLLFGDLAFGESGIDLIDRGRLGRVLELLRGDAQVLGDRVEERLRRRRVRLRRGNRRPAASDNCDAGYYRR